MHEYEENYIFAAIAVISTMSVFAQKTVTIRNNETGETFDIEMDENMTISLQSEEVNWDDSVKTYKQQAREGNGEAFYKLAQCYRYGLGVEQDNITMLVMCDLAEEFYPNNGFEGASLLGEVIMENDSVLFQKMSKANDSISINDFNTLEQVNKPLYMMLTMIFSGQNNCIDQANTYLKNEAESGSKVAKILLSINQATNSTDVQKKIKLWEGIAQDFPLAYGELGALYMNDKEQGTKDLYKAVDYFKMADKEAVLTRKKAKLLIECCELLDSEGHKVFEDAEMERLKTYAGITSN